MPNATLVKEVGTVIGNRTVVYTAQMIIDCKANFEYPTEFNGVSTHFGSADNQIVIHLTGSPDLTEANAILAAIELPTCTASLLEITTNVGTYIVDDTTNIAAHAEDTKFCKIAILSDDTTGDLEVFAFTKTTGVYPNPPAGKTVCVTLKEWSVGASGTSLTLVTDFIDRV